MTIALTNDWLGPMLIKELRQGIKSRNFFFGMLCLQAVVALALCVRVLSIGSHAGNAPSDVFFWAGVAFPLLLVMPWSALMAVHGERRAMTLELLYLTKLTPLRLILGKWCSVMGRGLVLLSAIVPYFFVRYFLGGVDVAIEAVMMGLLLLVSALVTAICLYLSAIRAAFAWWGLGALLLMIVGIPVCAFYAYMLHEGGKLLAQITWPVSLTLLATFALTIAYFLFAAASLIAPESISYEPVKRIAAPLVIVLITCFANLIDVPEMAMVCVFVAFVAGVDAMCAAPRAHVALVRPFVRLGSIGRLAGRLFHPGWPCAVFYVLALFGIYAAAFYLGTTARMSSVDRIVMRLALAGCAGLLSSWAMVLLFRPRAEQPETAGFVALALQVGLGVGIMMSGFADHSMLSPWLFIPAPGAAIFAFDNREETRITLGIVLAVSVVILLIRAWPHWRRLREVERIAVRTSECGGTP